MLEVLGFALTLVGSIGGFLWLNGKRHEWFEDRAFRRLFGAAAKTGLLVVCPTQTSESGSPNVATTFEDSLAQAELQTRLSRRDVAQSAKLHTQISDPDWQNSLILICGPVGNSVTRKLFEELKLPYCFKQVDSSWTIADQSGTTRHFPSGSQDEDLALVAALKNPWARPERRANVYLAAGINGLGTWGAAVQLASGANDLVARLKAERIDPKHQGFVAVLRVSRDQLRPPITKVLEMEAVPGGGVAA